MISFSRLLFAAARGARVEQYRIDAWLKAEVLPTDEGSSKSFRIHPDDEHLAYGPISTALQENARHGANDGGTFAAPYGSYWPRYVDVDGMVTANELHRSLFLLLLSEALADEGL